MLRAPDPRRSTPRAGNPPATLLSLPYPSFVAGQGLRHFEFCPFRAFEWWVGAGGVPRAAFVRLTLPWADEWKPFGQRRTSAILATLLRPPTEKPTALLKNSYKQWPLEKSKHFFMNSARNNES